MKRTKKPQEELFEGIPYAPKPFTKKELDEILSQKWPKEGWFSEEAARFQKEVPYIPTKNAGRKKIRELKSNS